MIIILQSPQKLIMRCCSLEESKPEAWMKLMSRPRAHRRTGFPPRGTESYPVPALEFGVGVDA